MICLFFLSFQTIHQFELNKGPFKYYVIKEVGGWGGQMMMFDDKVGGWGWLNDDVSKKYTRKKTILSRISLISLIQVTEFFFLEK